MASYEDTHVHAVYEAIAPHFSATRHKPWPLVAQFLLSLPPGSVGLDMGCGNGKYLSVNPNLHTLASDRSPSLVGLARSGAGAGAGTTKDREPATATATALLVADSLALPFRPACADFVICIAVVHHFSTRQRRRDAIAAMLACLVPRAGRALVYVWALEQAGSRRGWDERCRQDTLVPWVMKKKGKGKGKGSQVPDETYQRYYHLYREGELEEDAREAGGEVCESGYERDNWWAILRSKGGGE
ncbi:hypothetical protein EsDP_00004847 [Epichloe bromicola]|uniref:Methyltransferase type 11 domain-containing protein n=1 Tax=Epichloe bromicola TaxID=79588 RepID=A0ABQ0CSY0_9HYPO